MLPGTDRPLELSVTEEYRVGAVDGEPWEMLTSITAAAFDEGGASTSSAGGTDHW